MIILGINAYHADSSAAIFVDGKMIAAIEEERFRRVKHWAGFPNLSVEFCLKSAGVTIDHVDHIAIGRDPKAKMLRKLLFLAKNPNGSFRVIKERFNNSKQVRNIDKDLEAFFNKHSDENKSSKAQNNIRSKLHQIEHHRSHLASAFFASPYEEAALLSIDGSGDFSTTMIGVGRDNKIEILDSVDFPYSIGIFYTAFTQLLGFPHYGDEYKVMGLAPYGTATPGLLEKLRKVVRLKESNGLFDLDMTYFISPTKGIISYGEDHIPAVASLFNNKLESEFGVARKKDEPLTRYHKDLAASVQRMTEETIFHILTHLQKKTGLDKVCIAGGVAQNSVANGKITRNTPFKEVYIPSAGHDAGISMGAALYVQHHLLNLPRHEIWSAYTGSGFANEEIETLLNNRSITYRKLSDEELYDVVSDRLVNAGVVGWFSGQAEFGPRALGGRSILADPRRNDAKDLLNAKIKRRESFRPFAPSILKEYVNEYFEVNDVVPFMEKVFPIKKEKHAEIPAVTHVDGTGRLQTVDKNVSPRYYSLIEAFRKKTGVPILLNTSFNENEPIVNSPVEALECFLRTNMDMLVLENCVIER
jgi:carbamoyltransferase